MVHHPWFFVILLLAGLALALLPHREADKTKKDSNANK
jgi:F0F1-type ATP synthase assembly protein I